MKRCLIYSIVSVIGSVGLTSSPTRAADFPNIPTPATHKVAMVPQYVFADSLTGLHQAVLTAESQGFVPTGPPQFRFVPDLGRPGWVQYIAPGGY